MITLTQLEYVVAVDECRHFATAAERCFVTQPTLSMQIKKLEEDLGVTLFDRTCQPVVPTDIGVRLIDQAREVLNSAGRIKEIITEDKTKVEGRLKIGIIPTLVPYLLPLFIGDYVRKYPNVKIEVEESTSEDIIASLKKNTLDAALCVTPCHEERITEEPLFYEEIFVYASAEHPFLKKDKISIADIAANDIWMLRDGHCFRKQVINLCEIKQGRPKNPLFKFESNSLETLIHIVDKEGGFTLIPELAVRYMTEKQKKQVRTFHPSVPLREISVIYSRHYIKPKLVGLLCEEVKAVLPIRMLDKDRGKIVEWKTH